MSDLQDLINAIVAICFLTCGLPAYAQALEFEDPSEGMTEMEVNEMFCGSLLDVEYDVVSEIDPGLTRELPVLCGLLFPAASISAKVEKLEKTDFLTTFGVRYMERRNKWGVQGTTASISVSNPYPEELRSLLMAFKEGECRSEGSGAPFKLIFENAIPAHETYIVSFDYSRLTTLQSDACLDIVDASPLPLQDAGEGISQAISLARAGQWPEAGILLDLAIRSGAKINDQEISKLHDSVRRTVRALPASESVRNRDGYDFLSALRPEDAEYIERFERYQAASLLDRTEMAMLDVLSKAPVVFPDQVIMELSGTRTRAQRDASWAVFEGKKITLSGRVTNVRSKGLFLNAMLDIEIGREVSAFCYVKDFLNETAISISIGDRVTCTGKLVDYTLLFDSLTLSINDADFLR